MGTNIDGRVQRIKSKKECKVAAHAYIGRVRNRRRAEGREGLSVKNKGRDHLDVFVLLENIVVPGLEPVDVEVYMLVDREVLFEV